MAATIFSLFLAPFGWMTKFSDILLYLNVSTLLLVGIILTKRSLERKLSLIVLILIIFQIFLSSDIKIVNQLSQPLGREYTTDMRAFLKTYQLMKDGKTFYPAFYEGMAGLRSGSFHPDINAWRQPFIFYLWTLLPGNGQSIYHLWQIFLVAIIICAFLITKNIYSPVILWPYLHYSLVDLTILQPEWWGAAFLVFGLTALTRNKYLPAGIFFALSLACRELFIIPVICLLIYKRNIKLLIPLALFVLYYVAFHLSSVMSFGTEILRGYSNGNIRTLHSIFAYASWGYLIGVYRPILIIFVVSVATFIIRRKNGLLVLTFLPFFIFTALMAATGKIDATRDYWSIYFVPMLLISAPVIIFPPGK